MHDNEYTQYYHEVACNSSTWAHTDPSLCGCRGGGWWCSEVDTWHKCPIHKPNACHPEYYSLEDFEDDPAPVQSFAPDHEKGYAPDYEDNDIPF